MQMEMVYKTKETMEMTRGGERETELRSADLGFV